MTNAVAAVDLGATSGRVMIGYVSHNELALRPLTRFANHPVRTTDGLHWNILELYRNVLLGLSTAGREEPTLSSIGIDSWAVDYALVGGERMLATPHHYRDERTVAGVDRVHALVSPAELYAANGLQFLPFNTLYQLAAEQGQRPNLLPSADAILLIPDLLNFWFTGRQVAERTNASTTGLLNVVSGQWDDALIARLRLNRSLFPELVSAGTVIAPMLDSVRSELGIRSSLSVISVGSHDTASAVVAVPATTANFAYISCGTWGLVGVEVERPVLTEEGRAANFTNEAGVDGRVRFLHNVMGLWLLSESVRVWQLAGHTIDLPVLLAEASRVSAGVSVFDTNDPRFLAPGDIPARIAQWCAERGMPAPAGHAQVTASIIRSLAHAFASAVATASSLSGVTVEVVHLVGGGSQNALLCQLTADLCGVPVLAGPVEATAIGNVLVQARAQGFVSGSLESLRALVALAFAPKPYLPRNLHPTPTASVPRMP